MKRIIKAMAIVTILTALLVPTEALAIPKKFKDCPTTTQSGVTYLLYKSQAIVTKTPNKNKITIPYSVKYKGKKYAVKAIWDGTFSKNGKLRQVDLKCDLETIEDPAIFERNIKVTVHHKSMYKWLKAEKVKVTLATK